MTYSFKVIVEPDGDRWHAYCPALVASGAATWGYTRAEALRNIQDVVRMVVDSILEHGEALPSEPSDQVQIMSEPQVAVIV
jgi:predicted RNase H-like HicB family nuclease